MDSDAVSVTETDHQTRAPARLDEVAISVCVTCKASTENKASTEGDGPTGPDLLAATKAALGDANGIAVRAVQCLGVCKRPATAAVSAPDGYTFVFGDLQVESGAAALASFARSYRQAKFGLVPWRERAEVLRRGLVARIPPLVWSPDDGRPPQ
jgi:predicted metal-binding protein